MPRHSKKDERAIAQTARLRERMAAAGLRHLERMQKMIEANEKLIARLVTARDTFYQLNTHRVHTDGLSFDNPDGLFRVSLTANGRKTLNPDKAERARELVDEYVKNVTQATSLSGDVAELVEFLQTMFAARGGGNRLTYTYSITLFLNRKFKNNLLQRAQVILKNAVEASGQHFSIRYWTRTSKTSKWVQVPIDWYTREETINALLRKQKANTNRTRQVQEAA